MSQFFVPGIPVAKGSAKAFYNRKANRAFVVQDNAARQKPWVSLISVMAQEAGLKLIDGPVKVKLEFWMPRPKSHFNKKGLKATAPDLHQSKPDIDKIIRAVLDALTSIAYRDDSQICHVDAVKHYCRGIPGVNIEVGHG